ncbi:MAG TPA: ATPase, T2SS/T4P/T4SS family, partial [Phycisphaerae bacterium]|nr:ATPase, T2SS/T4P/T4SS family [Phycisphaerae bacterium]
MKEANDILAAARQRRATDVHIVSGSPVLFRVEGELMPATKEALSDKLAKDLSYAMLSPEQVDEFERERDIDFMLTDADRNRHRVNISFNDGSVGAVIRLLPSDPVPLETLRLPEIVTRVTKARKGLILITGSTSQGKTTTMTAMIDFMLTDADRNRHRVNISFNDGSVGA